ncbi:hypothetical protein FISHEDRAFT_79038 [Fistulina hepatica ATCC 64428]|uniref:Uncharacterized protein n=1 Tax=Fistulina hepatica ATCC 64428 TaxID=1128425 RepID=A0A0D6ZZH0_9AGAR|nr:hypothetical protein FISHEDRAFT_79038 [Fistulina hepatica ATCC 64428]
MAPAPSTIATSSTSGKAAATTDGKLNGKTSAPLHILARVTMPFAPSYIPTDSVSLSDFDTLVSGRVTSPADYPLASKIIDNVSVYDCPWLRLHAANRGVYPCSLDRVTAVLQRLIDEQRAIDTNKRNMDYIVVNTSEKMAEMDPEMFVE